MIDIEAIIRHASEKLKYCFENYKIRRYKFNNKISRTKTYFDRPSTETVAGSVLHGFVQTKRVNVALGVNR